MQKKFLALFLALCLLTAMTTGCGGNSAPQSSPASEPSSVADAPSSQETPEPPAEEPEPEPEPEEGPTEGLSDDWLGSQGLAITPQGDITYTAGAADMNNNTVGTFEAKAQTAVTETTDGVEPGYKKVIFTYESDVSACRDVPGATGYQVWRSAFDRYTGTSFEFDPSSSYLQVGESSQKEGFVTIVDGDDSYDVSIAFESGNNFPTITGKVTVTCPADYDGVVFQLGLNDSERRKAFSQFDFGARLYTIDELPYFGDGYCYFSYTNE